VEEMMMVVPIDANVNETQDVTQEHWNDWA
jgi:hypothetical protein